MLSQNALKAAMPLATVLDNHDLVLNPVPGTPLEALVIATRSDPGMNVATPSAGNTPEGVTINTYTPDIVTIEFIANAKDQVLNVCTHDQAMDNIVDVASNAVRGHITFAKNVVAPAVENLVTRVLSKLKDNTPSALLGMEVVVWNPPKPLLNSSFETAVRKFEETSLDDPVMNLKLPTITASEIIELMKAGSSGVDDAITEWAAGKGDLFFITLWENVFQITLKDNIPKSFHYYVYDCDEAIDNALAIYLLSRKLMDGPLPETEMSINTYNKTIVEYRNQSAAKICHVLDDLDKIEKGNILIRSMTDRVTTVYGSVYAKWIEAGGENEVLFGNLLTTPSVVSTTELTAKAADLKSIWTRHATLISTVERNRLFTRTKEILMNEFTEQMREITEGDDATLDNRMRITKLFGECLDNLREDELVDLWDASLKLLCHSRFVRTEARRILLGIERVKKENPTADVRECAAISAIEYIGQWVASQMQCSVI